MRRLGVLVLVGVLVAVAAACGRSGPAGATGDVVEAWKKAGLDPGAFQPEDGHAPGGGNCLSGRVAGLEVTICELPDADAAKKAEAAGLARVGDATGAALAQGRLLLVVADRQKVDPSGKKLKEVATAFRNR